MDKENWARRRPMWVRTGSGRWGAAINIRMFENLCWCLNDSSEPPARIQDPRWLSLHLFGGPG